MVLDNTIAPNDWLAHGTADIAIPSVFRDGCRPLLSMTLKTSMHYRQGRESWKGSVSFMWSLKRVM
jgi:hypothetical protein